MTKEIFKGVFRTICLVLVFGILICSIPAVAADKASDEAEKPATVMVLKALKDIPRGTKITDAHVELVEMKNFNIPSNAISDKESVLSKYATRDLYAGEYISPDQVTIIKLQTSDASIQIKPIVTSAAEYIVVTDYIIPNTGKDVSTQLQELIDNNGGSTIYFPDGEYVISRGLNTGAGGKTSVSIQLADGAVIKAIAGNQWNNSNGSALISLGKSAHANDIISVGSYYSVMGGTLDGNGYATGISVDSGRETVVRNICIKNTKVGVVIEDGANSGSSDCDFEDLTIIGEGKLGTTGIIVKGYDNSFTNIRVYNMGVGLDVRTGGNLCKGIFVYNDPDSPHVKGGATVVGIKSTSNEWFSNSHVVNCTKAFNFIAGSEVWDCTAEWTTPMKEQTVFDFRGNNLTASGIKAYFCKEPGVQCYFVAGDACTVKFIEGCVFDEEAVSNDTHKNYLFNEQPIIPLSK